LFLRQHRTSEAIVQYRESLRLRSDLPEVLNNLAWILATDPRSEFRDGAEAVRLAEQACLLTENKRALLVGTLAAAYAEAGRFDDAVKAAERARDTAQAAGEQQIAETNRKLCERYHAGKPYRDNAQP
jgi:protein O-mannosyl-transferase